METDPPADSLISPRDESVPDGEEHQLVVVPPSDSSDSIANSTSTLSLIQKLREMSKNIHNSCFLLSSRSVHYKDISNVYEKMNDLQSSINSLLSIEPHSNIALLTSDSKVPVLEKKKKKNTKPKNVTPTDFEFSELPRPVKRRKRTQVQSDADLPSNTALFCPQQSDTSGPIKGKKRRKQISAEISLNPEFPDLQIE